MKPSRLYLVKLLGAGLLTSWLAGCGQDVPQEENFQDYIQRAESSLQEGDIESAVISLKNALQIDGDNLAARSRLGELYLQTGNALSAIKEFRYVRASKGNPERYLVQLSDALLRIGDWEQVLRTADSELAASLGPGVQARVYAQRGAAHIGLGNLRPAREAFENALMQDPESIPAWLGQAALAVGEGRKATARSLIAQALPRAQDADRTEAWRLTAELDRLDGDLQAADRAYSQALDFSIGDNLPIRIARAQLRIEMERYDAVREDLEAIPKRLRKHPHFLYTRGLLALREQRYIDARDDFTELRQTDPGHVFGMFYLAVAHLNLDEPEHAESYLVQAYGLAPRSIKIGLLLGQTQYRLGKYGAATRTLEPMLSRVPHQPQLLSLLGTVYLAQGRTGPSREMLERALLQQPDSYADRMKLGINLMQAGKDELAVTELEKAAAQANHSAQSLVTLVMAYIRAGEYQTAMQAVRQLQQQDPREASYWNLQGLVESASGQADKARASYQKALSLREDLASARYNLARATLAAGNTEEAHRELDTLLDYHPDHLHGLMAMAELDQRNGHQEKARQRVLRAMEKHPGELAPRLWLARDYLGRDQPTESQKLLSEIRDQYAGNTGFLAALGEAQLLAGSHQDAIDTFRELVSVAAGDPMSHYLLARACAMALAYECLREGLVGGLQLDPSYPGIAELIHRAVSLNSEPAVIRKLLWRLQYAAPENLLITRLRGQYALHGDRPGEAVAVLEEAARNHPDDWGLVSDLVRAHVLNGNSDAGITLLRQWQAAHPGDISAKLLLGKVLAETGDEQQAADAFRQVLDSDPDHHQALNNLAWLLREQEPDRALAYAEKAVQLAPGYVTRDTLAVLLHRRGEHERAEELLRSAFGEQPTSQGIRFHLAQVLVSQNKTREARGLLEEILSDDRPFPERDQAINLLKTLDG